MSKNGNGKSKKIELVLTKSDLALIRKITKQFGLHNGELDKRELTAGGHPGPEQGSCVMEWLTMKKGTEFSDRLPCVDPILRDILITLNDSHILTDESRQKLKVYGMRALYTESAEQGPDLETGTWPPLSDEALEVRGKRAMVASDFALRRVMPFVMEIRGYDEYAERLRSIPPITDKARCYAAAGVGTNISNTGPYSYAMMRAISSANHAASGNSLSAVTAAAGCIIDAYSDATEAFDRCDEVVAMAFELLDLLIEAGPRYEPAAATAGAVSEVAGG